MVTTVHPDRAARAVEIASDSPLEGTARKMGLPSATALVVGSIIGTGVFTTSPCTRPCSSCCSASRSTAS